MIKRIPALALFFFFVLTVHAQPKSIVAGMKISRSVVFKKATYAIDAPADTSKAVLLIEGNDITIDFNNALLKGSNKNRTPDEFFGIAIRVQNGKNITIKNLKGSGYKVVLLARNVEKLTLINCDLSYNYRPHLNSTQEKEDVSDWMSYHHNEKDEWLRYGAAMYLRSCNNFIVKDCKVTGGQNALMLSECNDGMIQYNDFSFNSGIGIGMYRSNRNSVTYNRLIFNVRGYSHGMYNRGQDSAGILVYEQSSNNLFYKNNVTHGGDGFFLWAGQTTMDNGQGGCNDNMIRSNDFSYAPTNGIEVTFSRNAIIDNRIFECAHGIWGGYSYETTISNNKFRNNNVDIAIEHGQENTITYNVSLRSKEAIKLWSRSEQPADWGYAKNRDTRSRDYAIAFNTFNFCDLVFNLTRTSRLNVFSNTYVENKELYKTDSSVTDLDMEVNEELDAKLSVDTSFTIPPPSKTFDPFKSTAQYAGRKNIRVTKWGPYDFRYPIIWNTNPAARSDTMEFELLGPKGKWRFVSARGLEAPAATIKNNLTGKLALKKLNAGNDSIVNDTELVLEYRGGAFTDVFGKTVAGGKPYKVVFRKFFQPIPWEVLFYSLDTTYHNPIKTGSLFSPTERKAPVKTERVNKLDYAWWGGIKAGETAYKQFVTIASATADIEPGDYELSVTWDDAVRIYVDDKLVLNEWEPSRYKFDESPHKKVPVTISKGPHHFRVEHVELGGFATLALKLVKK
jgi:parallel beta-helix repeat protein